MPTVCLSLLREVSEKVRPPRTLFVPFPIGYPLGAPDQPELQHSIIRAALYLLDAAGPLPLLHSYESGMYRWTAVPLLPPRASRK